MENNAAIGRLGEDIAKQFLSGLEYEFQEANYRFGHLEIDLIFTFDNQLIIVEVKTRNTTSFGEPFEAVTRQKQKQIIRATNQYIQENELDLEVRFDVVSIFLKADGNHELEHIQDAFVP